MSAQDNEPTDLARLDGSDALEQLGASAPDEYEKRYMRGSGVVLYRDKSKAPWQIHTLMLGVAVSMVGASLAAGAFAPLIGLPVLLFIWMLAAVLRVTVSEGNVDIQYGLFGPKIPIAAIEEAKPTTYDWKKFGGWGIKRSWGGEWIYNMPGDEGRAVRIVWRNAKGKRRVTLIGSRRSEALAEAIARARRGLPAAASPAALGEGKNT